MTATANGNLKKPIVPKRVIDDYLPFLNKHKLQKGNPEKKEITLTGFGGSCWGSYHIKDEEYSEFLRVYKKTTNSRNIVERQKEVGPLLIDIDFRFDSEHK